jgi:hypothetical protein
MDIISEFENGDTIARIDGFDMALYAAAPQMRTALDSMVLNYAQSGRITDEFVRDVARMLLEIDQ